MITHSILRALADSQPDVAVSIFLPTHRRGREVRQDPVRLANLLARAQSDLAAAGLEDAEAILAPAAALVDDYEFWQHQDRGLVLYIDQDETRTLSTPVDIPTAVTVGAGFEVRPLLPLLTADGEFAVLTVTIDDARLYLASRFALEEDETCRLPVHPLRSGVESDYESPAYASPPNRPRVGSATISNAQVYGDGPPEFKKGLLREYADDTARAIADHLADRSVPLVIVADAEIGGHLRQAEAIRRMLAGTVEKNPTSLDLEALHAVAYAQVEPLLDRDRERALEDVLAALGRGDGTATADPAEIARAAAEGRIDVLLLDEAQAAEVDVADPLSAAVRDTLRHGGAIRVIPRSGLGAATEAAARLRY